LVHCEIGLDGGGVAEVEQGERCAPSVAEFSIECKRFLGVKPRRGRVPASVRQIGRAVEGLGAGRRRALVDPECVVEPASSFGDLPLRSPECRERACQSQDELRVAGRLETVESGAQVVVIMLE
jgi:hypothetical protein